MKRWIPVWFVILAACDIINPPGACGCSPAVPAVYGAVSGIVQDTAAVPITGALIAPASQLRLGCGSSNVALPVSASPASATSNGVGGFTMTLQLIDFPGTHCLDLQIIGPLATDTVRDISVAFDIATPPTDTTAVTITLGGP